MSEENLPSIPPKKSKTILKEIKAKKVVLPVESFDLENQITLLQEACAELPNTIESRKPVQVKETFSKFVELSESIKEQILLAEKQGALQEKLLISYLKIWRTAVKKYAECFWKEKSSLDPLDLTAALEKIKWEKERPLPDKKGASELVVVGFEGSKEIKPILKKPRDDKTRKSRSQRSISFNPYLSFEQILKQFIDKVARLKYKRDNHLLDGGPKKLLPHYLGLISARSRSSPSLLTQLRKEYKAAKKLAKKSKKSKDELYSPTAQIHTRTRLFSVLRSLTNLLEADAVWAKAYYSDDDPQIYAKKYSKFFASGKAKFLDKVDKLYEVAPELMTLRKCTSANEIEDNIALLEFLPAYIKHASECGKKGGYSEYAQDVMLEFQSAEEYILALKDSESRSTPENSEGEQHGVSSETELKQRFNPDSLTQRKLSTAELLGQYGISRVKRTLLVPATDKSNDKDLSLPPSPK